MQTHPRTTSSSKLYLHSPHLQSPLNDKIPSLPNPTFEVAEDPEEGSSDGAIKLQTLHKEDMTGGEEPGERTHKSPSLSGETERGDSMERTGKPMSEDSPLLSPSGEGEHEGLIDAQTVLAEDPEDGQWQETKSLAYMVLLTISIGGLQLAWAVELSNGTPYLLSLGMSKSLMALVWIAGPLSGALVQPYVGILSDNCKSRWGKRTPFMVAGSIATVVSLMALAWVREMVGGLLGLFGVDRASEGTKVAIIVVAVFFVYVLDFSINTGMILEFLLQRQR